MIGGGSNPIGAASSLAARTAATTDDSDLDASLHSFNRHEWIGCGKVWDDNIPQDVHSARSAARKIPDSLSTALITCPSLTVTELLLESYRTGSAHSSAKSASYNKDSPNVFVGDPRGLIFQSDI